MAPYRRQPSNNGSVTSEFSPTDSEFSTQLDEPDYVRNWGMDRVADWLRSINAGQYVDLFRQNHISGANLIDLDSSTLKVMGVKRVGDRVRIGAQAKKFRYSEYEMKRETIRVTAVDDQPIMTPPSSNSPRLPRAGPKAEKSQYSSLRGSSRPASPLHIIDETRSSARIPAYSPRELTIREQSGSYSSAEQTARAVTYSKTGESTSRFAHSRKPMSLIVDTDVANGIPKDKPWIRTIFDNARSAIVSVETCKTAEDIVIRVLQKGALNEAHYKSYCFWVLDGTKPDATRCRRLSDSELIRICSDSSRTERERLIFRKIHAGEPEGQQLESAAAFALHQQQKGPVSAARTPSRGPRRMSRNIDELPPVTYPMSPASAAERERHLQDAANGLERGQPTTRPRPRKQQELHGARPESKWVEENPAQYFPGLDEEKFQNLRRLSTRRSARLSRATKTLSTISTSSFASSIGDDAPPVPSIPSYLGQQHLAPKARPFSVYRESLLSPLDEESPIEPDRKSYISFGGYDSDAGEGEGEGDSPDFNVTDPDGNTVQKSHFTVRNSGGDEQSSLDEQLSQVLDADGEEQDEGLKDFLKPNSWENMPFMRGKLIGQGSFGSVYLALHASTAELMAVKQVELPSTSGTAVDAKKSSMVEALKREIGLLRELKHENIVSYLGSSSDANNLNIFLEYVPGGSIAKMLVDYGSLNEQLTARYVRQTLVGLAFLHSRDIIHRDIKGANILIDTKGVVKISDFGISKRVQDSKTMLAEPTGPGGARRGRGLAANRVSLQGSVFWMAPEVVKQTAYTRKADIWSLGCLIVEMLTGSHPHPDLSQLQAIFKIGGKSADPSPRVPEGATREAREFLRETFRVEFETRPEAGVLLGMAFAEKGKVP